MKIDFKKTTIKSYDETAEEYEQAVNSFNILPELNIFISKLNKGDSILDLGCGPGHHSKYFSDLGYNVIGIDLSKKMISIAKRKFSNIDFRVMDMYNLNFEHDIFNGIWASASLLHTKKKDLQLILKELNLLLKNKGILYISLKIGDGEKFVYDDRYKKVSKFYSFYNQHEIKHELLEAGFSNIEIYKKDARPFYDTNSWMHIFCEKII